MSRRKRTLKQAFIVTVAAAATATGAGCGNDVVGFDDDGGGEVISNPPPCDNCEPACPDLEPSHGAPCSGVGLTCYYGESACEEVYAECTTEGWQVSWGTCNPPPPECPADRPALGSLCEYQSDTWGGYPDWCGYAVETPCGPSEEILGCMSDEMTGEMVWTVKQEPASCEVPPSECHLYGEQGSCSADPSCQWLVPGCTDGPNSIAEGCYAAGDCATTGCGDWGDCASVVHDPCAGSACTACAAEIDVCLPFAPL